MTVGDFNGDKHVDLVVGTPVAGFRSTRLGLSLLPGKGDGTFQTPVSIGVLGPSGTGQTTVSVFSPHLLAADINGDGKLDLVVKYAVHTDTSPPCGILTIPCGNHFFNDIDTFLGNGDTTFPGGGPVARFDGSLGANGGNLGAGDFNADGKLDLVTALFGTGVLEWGLGDGTFRRNLVTAWTGLGPFVVVAELNGAAPPDLIVTDPANSAVAVIVNHSQTSGTDLAVILSQPPPDTPVEGVDFSYRATVLNEGPQDGTGVAVKESLPSGLKLVSATPSQGSCVGTITITCDLGAMPDVSAATIDFAVTPVAGGTQTDALQVAGSQADLNSKNDTASFTVTVLVPADMSVTGSSSVSTAATGDKVTYTFQVANAGPNPATNVVLTDSISDGNLVVSALATSQGSCTPTPGKITCTIGTMNSGAKVNISFALTMGPSEIVGNGLILTSDTLDTNTDNNNLLLNVNVNPADLTVSQSASVNTANVGTQVKFTINVRNNGPTQATNVMLNDSVPAGATIGSVQASQGTCPVPAASGLMSCALGSLAAAASATVSFVATPTSGGTLTNSATVGSDQVDPASSDNSTRLDVPVQDFSITPAAQSLTVARGGSGSEILTFTGQGGFTGNLDLKCSVSGQAPMPTCGLSPTTVAAGGTSTLTINAASISASLEQAPNSFHFGGGVFAVCLPLGIFGLIITGKSSKNRRALWLLYALLIAFAVLPAACGGGTTGPPLPQSFTVTVTATSVPSGIQHSTSIPVTVQ